MDATFSKVFVVRYWFLSIGIIEIILVLLLLIIAASTLHVDYVSYVWIAIGIKSFIWSIILIVLFKFIVS